jgi:hypothetical protein
MGKVAIGKARYLLNIMLTHLDVQIISFPGNFFLSRGIGKISFNLIQSPYN